MHILRHKKSFIYIGISISISILAFVLYYTIINSNETKDPKDFAMEVFEIYVENLQKVVNVVEQDADIQKTKNKIVAIKDDSIKALVKLGKSFQEFSLEEQKLAKSLTFIAIQESHNHNIWSQYMRTFAKYPELNVELSDFNTITRYAFYDLLKQQSPEEAERLGIK